MRSPARYLSPVLLLVASFAACSDGSLKGTTGVLEGAVRLGADSADAERVGRTETPPVREGGLRLATVVNLSCPFPTPAQAVIAGLRAGLTDPSTGSSPFELVVRDDGYDPMQTLAAVRELGGDASILGLVCCTGTPTAIAGVPAAKDVGFLWCCGHSGAEFLRLAESGGRAANVRASYRDEVSGLIEGLIAGVGLDGDEIGFFTQQDGFGDDCFRAGREEILARTGTPASRLVHARFDRELRVVTPGLATLLRSSARPRAVVVAANGGVLADLIRLADREGYRPLWCGLSFSNPPVLVERLGGLAEGVVCTRVTDLHATDSEDLRRFRSAVGPRWVDSSSALESFLVAEALRDDAWARGAPTTREEFAIRARDVARRLLEERRGGLGSVWPTVIRGGASVRLDWESLRERAR